jgi:hypothetical protein
MKGKIFVLGGILSASLFLGGCESTVSYQGPVFQPDWNEETVKQEQEDGFSKIDENSVSAVKSFQEQNKAESNLEDLHKNLEEQQQQSQKEAQEAENELNNLLASLLDAVVGTKTEVEEINQKMDTLNVGSYSDGSGEGNLLPVSRGKKMGTGDYTFDRGILVSYSPIFTTAVATQKGDNLLEYSEFAKAELLNVYPGSGARWPESIVIPRNVVATVEFDVSTVHWGIQTVRFNSKDQPSAFNNILTYVDNTLLQTLGVDYANNGRDRGRVRSGKMKLVFRPA